MKHFYYGDVITMSGDGRSGVARAAVMKRSTIEDTGGFRDTIAVDFLTAPPVAHLIARLMNIDKHVSHPKP